MMYATHDGALINLNYVGAVYKRKDQGGVTFTILAVPYNRINSLAPVQPHESNPKYEPRESYEIVLRQGLTESDATTEMLNLAEFVNNR